MLNIAYNSLRKRVATALVTLMNKYQKDEDVFSIQISREDPANIAGTATESLDPDVERFKSGETDLYPGSFRISILKERKYVELRSEMRNQVPNSFFICENFLQSVPSHFAA